MQNISIVSAPSPTTQTPAPPNPPAAADSAQWWAWGSVIFTIWLVVVVASARVMKLFRSDSIVGPERIGHDESAFALVANLCLGIGVGFFVPVLFKGAFSNRTEEERNAIAGVALYVVGITALLVTSAVSRGKDSRRIGLGPARIGLGIIGGITALVIVDPLVQATGFGVEKIFQHFNLPQQVHPMLKLMQGTTVPWLKWVDLVTACVLAPFAEELVFRGFLQTAAARGFAILFGPKSETSFYCTPPASRWAAVIVASLVFAAIHNSAAFFAPLFVLSVGFGYLYERTGNLWAAITAHGLFNLINTLVFLHVTHSN